MNSGGELEGSRLQAALLASELYLRTHPKVVGLFTILCFVAIALVHKKVPPDVPLAITFAAPLAFCTYGIGVTAGITAAVALGGIWFADALTFGVPLAHALPLFAIRMFSNLVIVALAAVAAMAARAREQYVEAQRELVALRSDVVAAFSHDLRSPLTAIMGFAEMLDPDGEDRAGIPVEEARDRILANASHLDRLIGDMLSAGHDNTAAPLTITTFGAEDLVAGLRAELEQRRRSDGVALLWQLAPGLPLFASDRAKVTSVVRNLVGNGLKLTTEGKVIVRVGYDAAGGCHRIEVEDTGPGIAPDALPHVFDRFFRAPEGRRATGFGVGLFIVKRFTDLLGGEVAVESEVGCGTRFTVTLPRLEPQPPTSPAAGR